MTVTDGDELTEIDTSLYRFLAVNPGATLADAVAALDWPAGEVEKSASALVDMGLLATDGGDCLRAVSPMLAEVTQLGAEEFELSARRAAVESRRKVIRQVIPHWLGVLHDTPPHSTVDVVTSRVAMSNVVMHYAERCRQELLSVAPGRGPGRIDQRTRMANLHSLNRGVQTRALYQHAALRHGTTRAYLRELTSHGAKIRVAPTVPGRSLVVDREVALLTLPGREPGQAAGVAVVRDPTVIAWVIATFEQLWSEASPLAQFLGRDHADGDSDLDHTRAAILRLMAEGEKDEAISRRLSISVRTCRRHIADYMAHVGASSRFQAGVIASRTGHLDALPGLPS